MDTQTVPSPDTTEQLAVQAQDQIMQPVAEDAATERTITVDGQEYQTNLPDGVQLITDGGSARYLDLEQKPLLPGDFDALQPGTYFIRGEREKMDDFKPEPEMVPVERHIEVKESEFGKTISRESLGERWSIEPDAAELMQTLGYEVVQTEHGPRISGAPTPETVKAAAGLAGVDIRFFDDVETIQGSDYLQTIAEGQYPASTKSEIMYKHDIEDDHLTTMVLGGEPLKQALVVVAQNALEKGGDLVDDTAMGIDTFTATIRGVISTHHELLGEAYGLEMGRRTVIQAGERIGIPPEETLKILEQAQGAARALHMNVKELH